MKHTKKEPSMREEVEDCQGCIRREEDWKRITKIEFRQDLQQKEIVELAKTSECLTKGMREVNATLIQVKNIGIGAVGMMALQLVGIDKAIEMLLGFL